MMAKKQPLFCKDLKGFAFGDKGYLGKKIFKELLQDGLKLITQKRNWSYKTLFRD
jgi:hypothetical protein